MTVGGGAQDVLDDAQLYSAIQTFLENPADHHIFQSPNSETPSVQQAWESLSDTRRQVQQTFVAQTMRPTISRGVHHQQRLRGARAARNVGSREPPDMDRMDPEDFVENLDGMACAAFSNVTEEVSGLPRLPLFLCAQETLLGFIHHCRSIGSANLRSHRLVFSARSSVH